MTDVNGVHFKDELRRSFIRYALVPALLFAIAVLMISVFLWNFSLYRETRRENTKLLAPLNDTVALYMSKTEENIPIAELIRPSGNTAVSDVYASLKSFVLAQKIPADFTVLDGAYEVVLRGNNTSAFTVPWWQAKIGWGALGRMKRHPGRVITELSKDYNTFGNYEIIIGRSVVESGRIVGYLVFTVSDMQLRKYFNSQLPYAVTDRHNTVFMTSNPYFHTGGRKLLPEYCSMPDVPKDFFFTGNEAVYVSATDHELFRVYTFSNTEETRNTFVLIGIMTLAALLLIVRGLFYSAGRFSRERSEMVEKIVATCNLVEHGDLSQRFTGDNTIEFQAIADACNGMLDNVQRLIDLNARETKEKYLAELKQLEMQFNPHFLYNTLETVKFLIKLDPDKAQKTILQLSELLRYSINNEITVVPIGDDIHYIENYLSILKLRFRDRFLFSIDVPKTVYACRIPKLVMQPVIGNAVKYGLEAKDSMELRISARCVGGRLFITVRDTGTGMAKVRLRAVRQLLRAEVNNTNHIGLYNVQRRIQLMYGRDYGLKIDSTAGEGTTVRLSMPDTRQGGIPQNPV